MNSFRIKVSYTGDIILEVDAETEDEAVEAALDEIDTWPEADFMENLDLQIENIAVKDLQNAIAEPETENVA